MGGSYITTLESVRSALGVPFREDTTAQRTAKDGEAWEIRTWLNQSTVGRTVARREGGTLILLTKRFARGCLHICGLSGDGIRLKSCSAQTRPDPAFGRPFVATGVRASRSLNTRTSENSLTSNYRCLGIGPRIRRRRNGASHNTNWILGIPHRAPRYIRPKAIRVSCLEKRLRSRPLHPLHQGPETSWGWMFGVRNLTCYEFRLLTRS